MGPRPARWYLLRAALVVAAALFGLQLLVRSDPYRTAPDDFISSWAAGRLLVSGRNPYDADEVLAVQRTANWTESIPYRIWYPPWAMPILAGFGILPYALGRFLWYLANIAACLVSADVLWRYYRGPPGLRPALWVLVLTFWPAVIAVRTGQISALVLLGVAGFLVLTEHRRWLLAGACLPLVAIKPQLLHLFWLALILWIVRERRWDVLLGAAGTAVALVLVAMAVDPAVVPQFLHMAAYEAPQAPASTLGTVLRLGAAEATGRDRFWLQFVPPLLSLAWFIPYWRRWRDRWDWREQASTIVLVSLLTTAYGWVYDQSVILVAIVEVVTALLRSGRLTREHAVIGGYLGINGAIFAMNMADVDAFWYIWVPFAFAAWWGVRRPWGRHRAHAQ